MQPESTVESTQPLSNPLSRLWNSGYWWIYVAAAFVLPALALFYLLQERAVVTPFSYTVM